MIYNPYIVYDIFSFNRYGYSCKNLLTCKKFVCNWCLYRISSRGDFQTAWSLICCGALCVWLIHKVRYDCFEFLIHSSVLVFDPLKWWTHVRMMKFYFWSISVGDTVLVIEIKLILVKRAVLKQVARYPKMVHFDENPIFRSDPISRFRLITIWILDMVKSGLIFSDDERWISLNIFIEYFNEWKAITSGWVQSPEVIAKIEQPLTYFKVNCFYTPDDYYEEDIIKKERADFFGTMIWSVAWGCPWSGMSHTVCDCPCIFHGSVWI